MNPSILPPVDIVVIGGGPAGCSAAVNAHCLGLTVHLIEQGDIGGQVQWIETIHNLVGGPYAGIELAQAMASQIAACKIPVTRAKAVALSHSDELWTVHCANGTALRGRAIIAATGTRELRLAEHSSVRGVCAEYEDKYIYDTSLEDFLHAKVIIIGSDRVLMSLVDAHGDRLKNADVRVLALLDKWYIIEPYLDRIPFEVIRVDTVDAVVANGNGYDIGYTDFCGASNTVAAHKVLTNLGKAPNSSLFEGYLELDGDGYLLSKDYLRRSGWESAYVVGDVAHKGFQRISIAIGEGASAALDYFYHAARIYNARGQ